MTVHTTSKYIRIPGYVRALRILLKGEGGAASIAYAWDCTISCNNPVGLNGGTTMSFKGSGSDTRFLGLTAGGGRGGRGHDVTVTIDPNFKSGTKDTYTYQQIPYSGSPTPGQPDRGTVPQSLIISSLSGNPATTDIVNNVSRPARVGGIGPGGSGSSGNIGTRLVVGGNIETVCGVVWRGGSNPGSDCTGKCSFVAGYCGSPCGLVPPGWQGQPPCNCTLHCCRCQKHVTTNMNGQGGTSGALIEARFDRNYLINNGIINSGISNLYNEHWLDVNSAFRQDGVTSNLATRLDLYNNPGPVTETIHSNLGNGSAEIFFELTKVYIKTSTGWRYAPKAYIKHREIVNNLTVDNWKLTSLEPFPFPDIIDPVKVPAGTIIGWIDPVSDVSLLSDWIVADGGTHSITYNGSNPVQRDIPDLRGRILMGGSVTTSNPPRSLDVGEEYHSSTGQVTFSTTSFGSHQGSNTQYTAQSGTCEVNQNYNYNTGHNDVAGGHSHTITATFDSPYPPSIEMVFLIAINDDAIIPNNAIIFSQKTSTTDPNFSYSVDYMEPLLSMGNVSTHDKFIVGAAQIGTSNIGSLTKQISSYTVSEEGLHRHDRGGSVQCGSGSGDIGPQYIESGEHNDHTVSFSGSVTVPEPEYQQLTMMKAKNIIDKSDGDGIILPYHNFEYGLPDSNVPNIVPLRYTEWKDCNGDLIYLSNGNSVQLPDMEGKTIKTATTNLSNVNNSGGDPYIDHLEVPLNGLTVTIGSSNWTHSHAGEDAHSGGNTLYHTQMDAPHAHLANQLYAETYPPAFMVKFIRFDRNYA